MDVLTYPDASYLTSCG